MARFCSSCGSPLDVDATFCPACGTTIAPIGSALAAELRAGLSAGVRSALQSSSLRVPLTIWAGVIEVFWIQVTLLLLLTYAAAGAATSFAVGLEQMTRAGGAASQLLSFVVISFLLCLVKLSFQISISVGLILQKSWACGLYMRSLPIVVGMTLVMALGALAGSVSGFQVLGALLGVGLLVLQAVLVYRGKGEEAAG